MKSCKRVSTAAKSLGIVERTLSNWVTAYIAGTQWGANTSQVPAEQTEIRLLHAELAPLRIERYIPGRATAYFVKVQGCCTPFWSATSRYGPVRAQCRVHPVSVSPTIMIFPGALGSLPEAV